MNLEQKRLPVRGSKQALRVVRREGKSSSTCFITVGTGAPRIDGRAKNGYSYGAISRWFGCLCCSILLPSPWRWLCIAAGTVGIGLAIWGGNETTSS